MIIPGNGHCWRCGVPVDCKANVLCLDCHQREIARVHARDTPDVPEVRLFCPPYHPPPERFRRPNSYGRRVFRNEKAQQ